VGFEKEPTMAFRLRIGTGNAAFEDGNKNYEIARILRVIATDLELHNAPKAIVRDMNGNAVGEWRFTLNED
jgi:hypothetical protein